MFKRLLIANRGEIAVRIIRACQELGIQTVAVYSDADYDALHVRLADEAYHIGPSPADCSYLNGAAIIAAAKQACADAIHPGYGFLSENAPFAELVGNAGITFIGPRPETISLAGDKSLARKSMNRAGLPLASGSLPMTTPAEAYIQAEAIGYPLMVKPVSGGGGIGMVIAKNKKELAQAFEKATHSGSTKSNSVILEKYITDARHIEVQIIADTYGQVVHLGERECSLQRRNQKILEETPSSALTPAMRDKVGELAVRAAKHIHYTSVGTVEFLLDKTNGQFYFLEINPRIQVEHGITEMITGIDLVKKQIEIAAGKPLTLSQKDITFTGHAIECRINAEDAAIGFLPSPGQVQFYHPAGGFNVRVDSGIFSGCTVHHYYDSLVAKVMAFGHTRGDAISTMRRALAEFRINGIQTTIPFHQKMLANPQFCLGDIDTQFIDKQITS